MNSEVVLAALADAFEAAAACLRGRGGLETEARPDADPPVKPSVAAAIGAREAHPRIGHRQLQVIECLEAAEPRGTTSGEVAKAIGYDQPNVFSTLFGLCNMGLAEKNDAVRPHRYRLAAKLRS